MNMCMKSGAGLLIWLPGKHIGAMNVRHCITGTSEYYLIRDFIDALSRGIHPPIDVYRAMEYTLPGIIAQEAVERGNVWLDVPQVR